MNFSFLKRYQWLYFFYGFAGVCYALANALLLSFRQGTLVFSIPTCLIVLAFWPFLVIDTIRIVGIFLFNSFTGGMSVGLLDLVIASLFIIVPFICAIVLSLINWEEIFNVQRSEVEQLETPSTTTDKTPKRRDIDFKILPKREKEPIKTQIDRFDYIDSFGDLVEELSEDDKKKNSKNSPSTEEKEETE